MNKGIKKEIKNGVRNKVLLLVLSIILVMGGTSCFSIYNYIYTNQRYNEVLDDIATVYDVTDHVKNVEPELKNKILKTGDNPDGFHYFDYLEEAEMLVQILYEKSNDENETENLDSVIRLLTTLRKNVENTVELIDAGDLNNAVSAKDTVEKVAGFTNDILLDYTFIKLEKVEGLQSQINDKASNMISAISIALVLNIVISITAAIQITNNIAKPLKGVRDHADQVAKGRLNVNKLHVNTKDEIEALASSFDIMVQNLKQTIMKIREVSKSVHSTSTELAHIAGQNTLAGEEISIEMEHMVSGMQIQSKEAKDITETINHVYHIASQVSDNDKKTLEKAQQSVNLAMQGTHYVDDFIRHMLLMKDRISSTTETAEELNNSSNEMNSILKSIMAITSQTNLLSLNATIEAARAGEAGKGFAVVAGEIGKLASDTNNFASKIGKIIGVFENEIKQMSHQMDENVKQIEQVSMIADNTYQHFSKIKASNELVVDDMKISLEDLEDLALKMESVDSSIMTNNQVIEGNKASSESISASVEEQLASLEELTAEANMLNEMAEGLDNIVKGFEF